jgi:hypothetical protein
MQKCFFLEVNCKRLRMARNKLSESIWEAAQFLGGFCPILPVAHILHKQKSQPREQLLID